MKAGGENKFRTRRAHAVRLWIVDSASTLKDFSFF